ncbi:MAG: bifunctional folylpolyglutamate synthase/dihydrofolate synthase [Pseudobutyrivibrio sp.]|nr:bifunctional folylpolyglutamate synthase/dihydrofolate synthase [Pseudobutyrivibrio sp.]
MKKYSYQEAISFFEELPHFKPPKNTGAPLKDMFSLDAELALLEKLNNPHMDLEYIHVAGTNGKGSTVAYISSILNESKLKIGTFASPFLRRYNELFVVNGKEISDKDFAAIFGEVKPAYDKLASENIFPSEYEILTVMGFLYFKKQKCDVVVLEVSMGGRVDTTNVIPSPLVTVIAPISYDHMSILGNTLTEIATEKAGIIKPGTKVVSAIQEPEVKKVLSQTCKSKKVQIDFVKKPKLIDKTLWGQSFEVDRKIYETSLLGTYQIENAALAILAIQKFNQCFTSKKFNISEEMIAAGIKNTKWFGRFTLVNKKPYVIVDGGHNRQGAKVLRESLEQYFPDKKITFVMGILRDKEVDIILDELLPIAKKCYTMAVPSERTMPPEELASKIKEKGIEAQVIGTEDTDRLDVEKLAEKDDVLCICGSLYLLSFFTF